MRNPKLFLWAFILFIGIQSTTAATDENVDGKWSPWGMFLTKCSKECGNGTQERIRSCTDPPPSGTGELCLLPDGINRARLDILGFPCNNFTCFDGWTNLTLCENCTIGFSYRETICGTAVCEKSKLQYDIKKEDCNRWDKSICPSPCVTHPPTCPKKAQCKDISSEEEPKTECECQMETIMNADKTTCITPPPVQPTPRPIPTLPPAQKTVATVISKSASVILIIFVSLSLFLFFFFKIFTPDRVIQMNMEISILVAHIFLMFPPSTVDTPFICTMVSICIHFFFTACYMFILLEALHMYFLVAYVVTKDGAFTKLQNILIGYGVSAAIIMLCICFQYHNYGGKYHCWLQLDTSLVYGVFIPVIIIIVITFILIEAAGAANYKPLPDYSKRQRFSAKISQRTNLLIIPFVLAHWIIGMFAEYEQDMAMYGTFSVLNGFTGFFIFFFHCSNNQEVRDKLKKFYRKSQGASV